MKITEKVNCHMVLTNVKGHLYPSRNVLNDSDVGFRIANRPDADVLPLND